MMEQQSEAAGIKKKQQRQWGVDKKRAVLCLCLIHSTIPPDQTAHTLGLFHSGSSGMLRKRSFFFFIPWSMEDDGYEAMSRQQMWIANIRLTR